MDIKINAVHFTADQKLEKHIETKIEKLAQFHDRIIGAEVFLRLDKAQNSENKITEIKLVVPGGDLFAKKQSNTFEKATESTIEALRRQIRKAKGKNSK